VQKSREQSLISMLDSVAPTRRAFLKGLIAGGALLAVPASAVLAQDQGQGDGEGKGKGDGEGKGKGKGKGKGNGKGNGKGHGRNK